MKKNIYILKDLFCLLYAWGYEEYFPFSGNVIVTCQSGYKKSSRRSPQSLDMAILSRYQAICYLFILFVFMNKLKYIFHKEIILTFS